MGVPRNELPDWNDIQIMVAQLHRKPLMEDIPVGTNLVIGPNARKPLELKIPLFVSDMSFGALSEEAKTAMALGAEQAGTGICSGEGGMLPDEQAAKKLNTYPESTVELMQVMARGCGHNHLNQFEKRDLAAWKRNIAKLAGIEHSGFDSER